MSAAVVHRTPTAAHVLGLIKKHPWTAGALLQAGQLWTGEQLAGRHGDRPEHCVQPRDLRPRQLVRRTVRRQLGVSHGVGHERPQFGPMRRRRRFRCLLTRPLLIAAISVKISIRMRRSSVRSFERSRPGTGVLLSCSQQCLRLIRRHNADASRPSDQLGVRPGVVVALPAPQDRRLCWRSPARDALPEWATPAGSESRWLLFPPKLTLPVAYSQR